jgi:hypothetical protein
LTVPESAKVAAVRPVRFTFTTARSVALSAPMSLAGAVRPSENATVIEPPPAATAVTCSLVRM